LNSAVRLRSAMGVAVVVILHVVILLITLWVHLF